MSKIDIVRKAVIVATCATALISPGSNVAITTALTMRALNYVMLGHYAVFAFRIAKRGRKLLQSLRRDVDP